MISADNPRSVFYVVTDRDLPDGRRLRSDPVAGPFLTRDEAQAALKDRGEPDTYIGRWTDETDSLRLEEWRHFR